MSVLFLAILLSILCSAHSEVLLEVSFDIAAREDTETAAENIRSYLSSENLKWIRYFHVLVSGHPERPPMRIAQMMFKDFESWAKFEQENLLVTHSLFDNYWVNSRRSLYAKQDSPVTFPLGERTDEKRGGFIFQFKYTVLPGKEQEFQAKWKREIDPLVKQLERNSGFLEHQSFNVQSVGGGQSMATYEFTDMASLSLSMHSVTAQKIAANLAPYLKDYTSAILTPGNDESAALFWPAAGVSTQSTWAEE
eukprot:NODE_1513_length_878_cov_82.161641_g1172_i0.p1 GENE.NODE_1513_length_878_cov_82.161641_g1172_i0~~NODE_1513_length_878_cov_82.161641_g1172_i0.p1  ORF type:complete len:251 (-),score=54.07 NODE_1513_length_878_cov_82.161641_g1172_i0:77-829(-)